MNYTHKQSYLGCILVNLLAQRAACVGAIVSSNRCIVPILLENRPGSRGNNKFSFTKLNGPSRRGIERMGPGLRAIGV